MAGGFLGLSIFIAAAVVFSTQQQSSDAIVRRALAVEIELADVLSALQEAELGQRGFLLSGDASALASYRSALSRLNWRLDDLDRAIDPIEDLQAPFQDLKTSVSRKQAEMGETLALDQAGQRDEAVALVSHGNDKRLMDDIRARIEAMDARQDAVVAKRETAVRRVSMLTAASTTAAVTLLGLVTRAAMREVRRRGRLSRFLPPEIAPRLAEGDLDLQAGREMSVAIAFVDIRGSAALAESLPPTEFSAALTLFRRGVSVAAKHAGGLVDKFIGDGALVVFGALDEDPRSCVKALIFARDLAACLAEARSVRTLEVGIGIHHGRVFCGVVGERDRLEFTVLGDAVNVASRLETMTRTTGHTLLVSEAVLSGAGESAEAWEIVGEEPLRGRREPVVVYGERRDKRVLEATPCSDRLFK